MLSIYHSNRQECLLERLTEMLAEPLADPLQAELIVAHNQGTARWLALRVAERCGVAANLDFPLAASFVWRVFRAQFPDLPERSVLDRDTLLWRCMALLPGLREAAGFEELAGYVAGEDSELRCFQLCTRIADLFDQYLVYRPDWIDAWERGEGSHWQARLWREVVAGDRPQHRAQVLNRFAQACANNVPATQGLPERVSVFAGAGLAPAHLRVVAELARAIDVHLFVPNPCLTFWEDIVSERERAWLRDLWRRHGRPDASEYFHVGNPLLASLGAPARDFQALLHEFPCRDEDYFEQPQGASLLVSLQTDILLLQERGADPGEPPLAVAPQDCSVQVHSCHGPMREVEVLHDRLLDLFERIEDLQPTDVAVMVPDIDVYAPYVAAVFGGVSRERRIPWNISDLSPRAEHPLLDVVRTVLDLASSRLAASEVLSVLETPAVLRRLDLDEADAGRIRRWVRETGVRWGLDGADRSVMGLPSDELNTWTFGLDRLLLGYAAGDDGGLYAGIAPFPGVEGTEAEPVGVLCAFVRRLGEFRTRLREPQSPRQWQHLVSELLDVFFDPSPEEEAALQGVRDGLAELVSLADASGFCEPLPVTVIKAWLDGRAAQLGGVHRFLTGGISFCNLVPLRSIPFRVVCLLGMNDRDYPRRAPPSGFDLMAADPRRGDRSRREDDRYLFLEALLSARDVFYVSYAGRSARDDSEMMPSVLVSELLEAVQRGYQPAQSMAGKEVLDQIVVHHPLQPFSSRCFGRGPSFSYASEWAMGRDAASHGEVCEEPPFASAPLPEPEPGLRSVELSALQRFFRNPARYFLEERLGVRLREADESVEDVEPFSLDALGRYGLKQALATCALQGEALEEFFDMAQGRGELPRGGFARTAFGAALDDARKVATAMESLRGMARKPLEVDLEIGAFTLRGWLSDVTERGFATHRCANLKGRDVVALWLEHLVLCVVAPAGCELRSTHVAQDFVLTFPPLAQAREQLEGWLQARWTGLHSPLPFFADTSWAYADKLQATGDHDAAIKAARSVWTGVWQAAGQPGGGEGEDPYYRTAFRGCEPQGDDFVEFAARLLLPVAQAARKEKLE